MQWTSNTGVQVSITPSHCHDNAAQTNRCYENAPHIGIKQPFVIIMPFLVELAERLLVINVAVAANNLLLELLWILVP